MKLGGPINRRELLRILGAAAAAPVLPAFAVRMRHCSRDERLTRIGIQLYTVRSLLARDLEGTLGALATIGYREVELAGNHGRTPKELRAILDRHSLVAPSAHVPIQAIREDWPRALDDAATMGHSFLVCPWIDQSERSLDRYRRIAELFNRAGGEAKRSGIRFAYHNHDFEFASINGITPYDLLLAECDRDLVSMEMDLFWITKAGRDPLEYFERHPGRFPLVHVKDMTSAGEMADVGAGTIDFARIIAKSNRGGILHYFVEHDQPPSPLESARVSHEFLRALGRPRS